MSLMAVRATFTGFDPYKLIGVRVRDRELGRSSYATVLELEYMGLKCAGKKIHELLLREGNAGYIIHKFEEECRLLSQVCHPNIVQFMGVYFQQGVQAPILVMEFLPTNLTSCIEQYGILPKEISYSILHNVALGLCYLHSQTPPIIHQDVSSNNVLLTPNMTAKISDLGVARILDLTPLQVSRMIQAPGTPTYMPPEVMAANPKYDTSVDEFSYGILMIHVFSGQWPEPQIGTIRIKQGRLIPVSEAERREIFLQVIGNDHPLMNLIHRCINNDTQLRPHADEIVRQVSRIASQFPASFANRLEMLRRIETVEKEKRVLTEETERNNRALKEKNTTISAMSQQLIMARKHLTTKKQGAQAGITWKQCAKLPTRLSAGMNTIINGKVYCGGGLTDGGNGEYIVYCYDQSEDKWATLPPLPVKYFGLGQINGKLVAVGGQKKRDDPSNDVYTYSAKSQKWKHTVPPMPTNRCFPGVVNLPSGLVVAGGYTSSSSYTAGVEIFELDTSQWYRTDPLPIDCCNISLLAVGNKCYALGGYRHPSRFNQTLYASADILFLNAVPSKGTTHSGSSDTHSAWKTLPNTPTYRPAAAVLAGNLFAIGGNEISGGGASKKEVFMYSPSLNSWIYISDLPAPRSNTVAVVLSATEILVIGGQGEDTRDSVCTVYMGTLALS